MDPAQRMGILRREDPDAMAEEMPSIVKDDGIDPEWIDFKVDEHGLKVWESAKPEMFEILDVGNQNVNRDKGDISREDLLDAAGAFLDGISATDVVILRDKVSGKYWQLSIEARLQEVCEEHAMEFLHRYEEDEDAEG